MLERNYDHQVQSAFGDIVTFLSRIGRQIRGLERKEKVTELTARIEAEIDIGDNCIDGEIGSESNTTKNRRERWAK
jgi:hypothetical protein